MSNTPIVLTLPRPFARQQEIKSYQARRKVLVCPRRWGKTTLAGIVACEKMLAGKRVLLSSTTQEQADAFWDKARLWLGDLIAQGIVEKNEQRRILEFRTHELYGRIHVKTGADPDVLRGDWADFLVLDECARLDPRAWHEVGAPMLLDTNGEAMFISTPAGRNWFFKLYQEALAGDDPAWKAWRGKITDNPYISPEALRQLMGEMSEMAIRQELYAEFLEDVGQVFRGLNKCIAGTLEDAAPGKSYVIGFDVARHQDFSVLACIDVRARKLVAFDRFQQVEWTLQVARAREMSRKYNHAPVWIDATHGSQGDVLATYLQQEGIPTFEYPLTWASKRQIVEGLSIAIENEELHFPDIPSLVSELMSYGYERMPSGGLHTGAPEGEHDDCVVALALAWHGAQQGYAAGLPQGYRMTSPYARER